MSVISALAGSAYFTQPTQNSSGISGAANASSNSGAGGQVSANISGPGQLFSELQQLQAQDPTKFQQVVSQIANQLQSAAQQQGSSSQGSFLTNLANTFKNIANGGDLSQLKPHHHGHHGQGTYNSNGQAVPSSSGATATSDAGIQSLFQTISSEVAQALGGSGAS
jgi:hypothetical protein